jgi:hypothetical protein
MEPASKKEKPMRPETLKYKVGWRTVAVGSLLALLAVPQLHAQKLPPPPPPGLGARIFGTGGPVTVQLVPTDALFTSDVYLFECNPECATATFLGTNRDSKELSTKPIPDGEEILIEIITDIDVGGIWSGPAHRNYVDHLAHAIVTKDANKLTVAFELTGAKMSVPFSGLNLTPAAGSDVSLNLSGGVDVLPIVAGEGSGVSISLGEAGGWRGTVDFDGSAPNAQLTYTAQSASGLPDLIGRHTTSADGLTDLQLVFPRATGKVPLQVNAFLAGQKVASTQVDPTLDQALTFAPARYLAPKRITITVVVVVGPDGTVIIIVVIQTGLTGGTIAGGGDLSFDTLELTLSGAGIPASSLSEVTLSASPGAALSLDDQSLSAFGQLHRALDGGMLVASDGTLTVEHGASANEDPGVAIDLADVAAFDVTWSPFILLGITPSGSSIAFDSRGTVKGVPDQDLGTLRVTQLTMADSEAEIQADFSTLGSPAQRVQVYDHGVLVADVAGHTGAAALALAWPTGVSRVAMDLGSGRLPGYSLPFPEDTYIRIPGGPEMRADRVVVLAEKAAGSVDSLSQLSLRSTSLPPITLTGEVVTPVAPF